MTNRDVIFPKDDIFTKNVHKKERKLFLLYSKIIFLNKKIGKKRFKQWHSICQS